MDFDGLYTAVASGTKMDAAFGAMPSPKREAGRFHGFVLHG
ncbi:MAG: hypothetical protein ACLSVD_18265 [Eggerthellaceae bacterium]